MTYTSPTWVDVPPGTIPPAGAPPLDAAVLQPLTDAVARLDANSNVGAFTVVGPKTANYTAVANDFVLWDTTGALLVQTLPTAPPDKTIIGAKIVTLGAGHTVTINAGGVDVFNKAGGGTSLTLSLLDQAVQLEYKAGIWIVTGIDLSLSQLDARYSPAVTTVAYAATVTPAVAAGVRQVLNIGPLTGNITLANPTGSPVDGQNLQIRMAQDGTGSRTVSFGTAYAFGTDVTAALVPTAASAKWEMLFAWDTADSKWRALSIVRGF